MRLLSGLVASSPLVAILSGDPSLSGRPMKRIADPLRQMGAQIEGDRPPIRIIGSEMLNGIRYETPVASAQIKSCILLAGLRANGKTTVVEPNISRDHTERFLLSLGTNLNQKLYDDGKHEVSLVGGTRFGGFNIEIPADISSAAFFMVAAALVPESNIKLREVNLNATRTGILDVLKSANVDFNIDPCATTMGEDVGDIEVRYSRNLVPFEVKGDLVPRLIDEIPVLAILATQCDGTSIFRDVKELRVKESDRIEQIATGLRKMGVQIETWEDGFSVTGPVDLQAAKIDASGDHRIAMSFLVAGLVAAGETEVHGADTIATSFPRFESELWRLAVV